MSRFLSGLVLALLCAPVSADEKQKPKDPPPELREKIDGKVDRSLTGHVEKIEAKEDSSGVLVVRIGENEPLYRFQIDAKTKILTNKGEPLAGGLNSRLLTKAEVRVEFIDVQPKGEKPGPDAHLCRTVQIINPGK